VSDTATHTSPTISSNTLQSSSHRPETDVAQPFPENEPRIVQHSTSSSPGAPVAANTRNKGFRAILSLRRSSTEPTPSHTGGLFNRRGTSLQKTRSQGPSAQLPMLNPGSSFRIAHPDHPPSISGTEMWTFDELLECLVTSFSGELSRHVSPSHFDLPRHLIR
jgi:hypothetical protein